MFHQINWIEVVVVVVAGLFAFFIYCLMNVGDDTHTPSSMDDWKNQLGPLEAGYQVYSELPKQNEKVIMFRQPNRS